MKLEGRYPELHLTYCTNIHPGETWEDVFANLQRHLPALKARLAPDVPFGVGLRLANIAAAELLQGDRLVQFRQWLDRENLYVFTLNGFPYGSFHHQVVKDRVYAPDWTEVERLEYTLRLTEILAALLPAGMDGGISTVPLSYKPWWSRSEDADTAFRSSSLNLARLALEMARIERDSGTWLHVDLEPEPNGAIENASETVEFFQSWLLPVGGMWLAEQLGCSRQQAEALLLRHVNVCYDTCHFALEYEEPAEAIAHLQAADIRIGKVQISSALRVDMPTDIAARQTVVERLRPFAESTYLHQAIARQPDDTLSRYVDLDAALPNLLSGDAVEWRIHFHVPIFLQDYQILQSTQDHISGVIELLGDRFSCHHLEIETYTWDVLPAAMKQDIQLSIQREYEWVLEALSHEQSLAA
ncbi:MAG: metabolite traffic protein EboE [Cyanobacteria bacterium J06642_2]